MSETIDYQNNESASGAFLLYGGDPDAIEAYVHDVAGSTCDPGARRALQILHGLEADAGGDKLLVDVCEDIAQQIEWGRWPEIVKQAQALRNSEQSPRD